MVKLVKQQIDGSERLILKTGATPEDLRREAARLREKFGYEVKLEGRPGAYLATHRFFRGKYVLALEVE